MEQEWKIAKADQACALCGSRFGGSASYFSALFEQGDGFERRDYCASCFKAQRPEGVYSFWKTALPKEDEGRRRPTLDPESVLDFFRRLGEERATERVAFRYLLALMLTRKKILKFLGPTRGQDGREGLVFAERRGGDRHEVPAVEMDESALAGATEELSRLLGIEPVEPAGALAAAPKTASATGPGQPGESSGC